MVHTTNLKIVNSLEMFNTQQTAAETSFLVSL